MASSRHHMHSMQSIDAVLGQADYGRRGSSTDSSYYHAPHADRYIPGHVLEAVDEDGHLSDDEFGEFDRLIEAYEIACADADFQSLLSLPLPADPEDIWSEIEDIAIRTAQWDHLQQLMQKFDKHFDTDFLAGVVSSGYEDEQKVYVVELALHSGWNINSPRSDGGYILRYRSKRGRNNRWCVMPLTVI